MKLAVFAAFALLVAAPACAQQPPDGPVITQSGGSLIEQLQANGSTCAGAATRGQPTDVMIPRCEAAIAWLDSLIQQRPDMGRTDAGLSRALLRGKLATLYRAVDGPASQRSCAMVEAAMASFEGVSAAELPGSYATLLANTRRAIETDLRACRNARP
jgi:hypothetical protein